MAYTIDQCKKVIALKTKADALEEMARMGKCPKDISRRILDHALPILEKEIQRLLLLNNDSK